LPAKPGVLLQRARDALRAIWHAIDVLTLLILIVEMNWYDFQIDLIPNSAFERFCADPFAVVEKKKKKVVPQAQPFFRKQ
jgi:hypothetical protein